MERRGWAARTLLLALVLGATLSARAAVGYYPRFSPFFFLCTHHGELEGDGEQGEVLISLHIAGSPTYYVPGQEYHGRYLRLAAPGALERSLHPARLPGGFAARAGTNPTPASRPMCVYVGREQSYCRSSRPDLASVLLPATLSPHTPTA